MQSNIFQTNTFNKGMNLDTDITFLGADQYRYAENVRVVTNDNGTTGVLQNIQSALEVGANDKFQDNEQILYSTTIKQYIVILTVNSEGINTIYRIDNYDNPPLEFNIVVRGDLGYTSDDNVKIVCNYENEEVCNAYIACDGKLIKSCNLLSDKYVFKEDGSNPYVDEFGNILNPQSMEIVPSAVLTPLHFVRITTGNLQSGKVQYAYQLFNNNGNTTTISPVSELISITDSDQPDTVGNAMYQVSKKQGTDANTTCNKGVQLSLKFDEQDGGNIDFDSIRIFRIHYSSNTDQPTIGVIVETGLMPGSAEYTFTDSGQSAETSYTVEEFNALVTVFNAATIEIHQNRLFAANVQDLTFDVEYDARAYRCDKNGYLVLNDSNTARNISKQLPTGEQELKEFYESIPEDHDCINPYNQLGGESFKPTDRVDDMQYSNITRFGQRLLGGSGPNVNYTFVYHSIILDQFIIKSPTADASSTWNCDIVSTDTNYNGDMYDLQTGNVWTEKYRISGETSYQFMLNSYLNPEVEGYMLGYMRDEIYRFGIVFYNNKSQASPVHWIGDIRMPFAGDYIPFYTDGYYLYGRALGLRFEVNNLPKDVVSYEIVRCDRTENDRTIVMQAVIGNTVYREDDNGTGGIIVDGGGRDGNIKGFITGTSSAYPRIPFSNTVDTSFDWFEEGDDIGGRTTPFDVSKVNKNIKIFIAPEIDLTGEQSANQLSDCYIEHLYYDAPMATSTSGRLGGSWDYDGRKYFNTPAQYVTAFTNDRTECSDRSLTLKNHSSSNIEVAIRVQKNAREVTAGVGKRYLMWHNYGTVGLRTDIKLSGSLQYPPILEQGALADVSSYYRLVGNKYYMNYGVNGTNAVDGYGCNKRGFFGSCLVGAIEGNEQLNDSSYIELSQIYNCNETVASEVRRQTFNPFVTSYVNFKRTITPYSGNNYSARQNSTYIGIAAVNSSSSNVTYVYGGDTYLGIHDHLTSMSFPDQRSNDDGDILDHDDRYQSFFVDYFPFETTINLTKTFGQNVSSTVEDRRNYIDVYLHNTITGGTVGGYHTQTKPYYAYNDAYSAGSTAKVYTSVDDDVMLNQTMTNRIRNSMVKTAGEKSDSFTKFQQADYLDVDSQYGDITNLVSFRDKLLYFQEDSVGIAAVNERSLITDNNLTELTLGTGGVLTRFDNITTANGDGIINDPSITDSRSALYWYDNRRNEICRFYDRGVEKLSKTKQVQSFLNDRPNSLVHDGIYDSKYNEVQLCFYDKAIVFNELVDQFTSFYTFNPDKHAEFANKLLYIKDNAFYVEQPYEDNKMVCKLQIVINKDSLYTKVFDNVFFGGLFDDIYYSLQEVKFNTKTQQSQIFPNPLNNEYSIDYREETYRFPIGREEANNDTMSYPGRLRGKYLICDYTICCDNQHNFVLPNINTTYRRSLV